MTNLWKDHIDISLTFFFITLQPLFNTLRAEQFSSFRIPRMQRHIMQATFLANNHLRRLSSDNLISFVALLLQLMIHTARKGPYFLLLFFLLLKILPLFIDTFILFPLIAIFLVIFTFKTWLCIRIFFLNFYHYTCSQ